MSRNFSGDLWGGLSCRRKVLGGAWFHQQRREGHRKVSGFRPVKHPLAHRFWCPAHVDEPFHENKRQRDWCAAVLHASVPPGPEWQSCPSNRPGNRAAVAEFEMSAFLLFTESFDAWSSWRYRCSSVDWHSAGALITRQVLGLTCVCWKEQSENKGVVSCV